MNNQRLPAYPEHPEPTERHESAEFEKEARPRLSPGASAWLGIALLGFFVLCVATSRIWLPVLLDLFDAMFGSARPQGN